MKIRLVLDLDIELDPNESRGDALDSITGAIEHAVSNGLTSYVGVDDYEWVTP